MAVLHFSYDVNGSTPTQIRVHGTDKRRGASVVITFSQHSTASHCVFGSTGLNYGADEYGLELAKGDKVTLEGWFTAEDVLYALTSGGTGEVHVLIIGG